MPASLAAAILALQTQVPTDSIRRDTLRLETLEVSVARAATPARRLPASVGFIDSSDLRRARVLAGLDEAVGRLPGLVVLNRNNPSLDQRLVIRGAGSRANFGIRGVRILIDGLPQTLPDGQSQLSNLDLTIVSGVEALVGSASAIHGNAAGGVVAFSTEVPTGPAFARARTGGGELGTSRLSLVTGAARGSLSGLVAATRYQADGFRQHSRTLTTQLTLAANAVLSPTWLARVRYFLTDSPRAENPGALTAAELAVRPDSAAAANLLRGADKSVIQHQAGLTLSHAGADGRRLDLTFFGLLRELVNPLATAPPPPVTPTSGTWSAIDRVAGGGRLHGEWPLARRLRLGFGADLQSMADDRVNRRSNGGRPTATVLVDQRETVTEMGPFVGLRAEPHPALLLSAGLRYDHLSFQTRDRVRAGGIDRSGRRTMAAASGSVGASLALDDWTVWSSGGSAFETPTTTELANRPDGSVGFNARLDPQGAINAEIGVRHSGPVTASLALYHTAVTRAIVQAREVDGRAYFENAGRLRHRGIEAGFDARLVPWLRAVASYTHSDSRFIEYRPRTGARVDTLDGRRVPAIPRHWARLSLLADHRAFTLELEQQLGSGQPADDANTVMVDGLGAGVTNVRIATRIPLGSLRLAPFAAVHNLFDRRYVGSVNVNGAGGRFFEPSPGRWAFLGLETSWRPSE